MPQQSSECGLCTRTIGTEESLWTDPACVVTWFMTEVAPLKFYEERIMASLGVIWYALGTKKWSWILASHHIYKFIAREQRLTCESETGKHRAFWVIEVLCICAAQCKSHQCGCWALELCQLWLKDWFLISSLVTFNFQQSCVTGGYCMGQCSSRKQRRLVLWPSVGKALNRT